MNSKQFLSLGILAILAFLVLQGAGSLTIVSSDYMDVFMSGHDGDYDYLLGTLTGSINIEQDNENIKLYYTEIGFSPNDADTFDEGSIDVYIETQVTYELNGIVGHTFTGAKISQNNIISPVGNKAVYGGIAPIFDLADGDIVTVIYSIDEGQIGYDIGPADGATALNAGLVIASYEYIHSDNSGGGSDPTNPTDPEATTGTASIVVKGDGQLIRGATVELGGMTRVTAAGGTATFQDLNPGSYEFTVSAPDYEDFEYRIFIQAGETSTMTVSMAEAGSGGWGSEVSGFEWNTAAILSVVFGLVFAVIVMIIPGPLNIKGFLAAVIALGGILAAYGFGLGVL
jgi:hypothetical protein